RGLPGEISVEIIVHEGGERRRGVGGRGCRQEGPAEAQDQERKCEQEASRHRLLSGVHQDTGSVDQAVSTAAACCKPKRSIPISRSLNFCTLPVTVVGYSSTKTTYRGTL